MPVRDLFAKSSKAGNVILGSTVCPVRCPVLHGIEFYLHRAVILSSKCEWNACCLRGCCAVLIPSIVLNFGGVEPFHRGFFCDDESIRYPYREDTVPDWAVGVVGVFVPAFTVSSCCICIYGISCCNLRLSLMH